MPLSGDSLDFIEVAIGVKTFVTHRGVLTRSSALLKQKLKNCNIHRINLNGVSPDVFKALLHFMYFGELKASCQILHDVYNAARKLRMEPIMQKCFEKLQGADGKMRSYIYVYVVSKKLGLSKKWKESYEAILKNFEVCTSTEEFLDLTVEQVCEILSGNPIGATSEVEVFLAALKWLHHNFALRQKHAVRVLSCVRFTMMSTKEILYCFKPPMIPAIAEIAEVRCMLLSALCYVAAEKNNLVAHFQEYSSQQRTYLLEGGTCDLWDIKIDKKVPCNIYKLLDC